MEDKPTQLTMNSKLLKPVTKLSADSIDRISAVESRSRHIKSRIPVRFDTITARGNNILVQKSTQSMEDKPTQLTMNSKLLKPVTKLSAESIDRISAVESRSRHIKSRIPIRRFSNVDERISLLQSRELKLIKDLLEIRQELNRLEEQKLEKQLIDQQLNQVPREQICHQQSSSVCNSPSAVYVRPHLKQRFILEELDSFSM